MVSLLTTELSGSFGAGYASVYSSRTFTFTEKNVEEISRDLIREEFWRLILRNQKKQ
jgi:hypothetical protein